MSEPTGRRGLLGRSLFFVAGALGLGLGPARVGHAAQAAQVAAVPAMPGAEVLTLHGRDWHLQVASRKRGEIPTYGDRIAMFGELLDAPDGAKVGEFYATGSFFGAPFGTSDLSATNLEQHSLNLRDGTLVGIGTASGDEAVYAIVGGTGRYSGARGSYVARLNPLELGGDGTALLTVTLTA